MSMNEEPQILKNMKASAMRSYAADFMRYMSKITQQKEYFSYLKNNVPEYLNSLVNALAKPMEYAERNTKKLYNNTITGLENILDHKQNNVNYKLAYNHGGK